ncbi:DDE Tnp4 domain-containing protein [Trichonephila clavipes]|nr:DDE Tnp4 domain-containing protein [Trichonephila clavipes]
MPSGAICFVSHLHCGRVSDKKLFLRSKPMDLLEPNDVVMADKGFLIKAELDKIGCKLKIPLFLKNKIQFHASKTVGNCKVSNKPVTVERAVSSIKQYK